MENFGERIVEFRESLSYNQIDFAGMLGISSGSLSGVEKGKRNLPFSTLISLCGIADVNNINLRWLLLGKGEMIATDENETLSANELESLVLRAFNKLSDDDQMEVISYINKIAKDSD